MHKKILFINSERLEKTWYEYLDELKAHGYRLEILSNDGSMLSYFRNKNVPVKKLRFKIPLDNKIPSLLFFLLRPLLFLFAFVFLLIKKSKHNIDTIVCFGLFEKLHFTRAAKLLKLKTLWIINPCSNIELPKISESSLSRVSQSAKTICLSDFCKQKLEGGKLKLKNVEAIKIGISNRTNQEQKNIFERLAHANTKTNDKKFFTVGTMQDLKGNVDHIEMLLHATKNCKELIPHIQLIIVGEGPERKNLTWMAKKMEIADLVWFVGEHKHPQKWFNNFDIYVTTSPTPSLKDIQSTLMASLSSLSVIAPQGLGYDEYIIHEKTGLLKDINDSEELSRAIIELQQNSQKRISFGKNGQEYIELNFQLPSCIKQIVDKIEG